MAAEKTVIIYEICRQRNGYKPLMTDPVFRKSRDAKAFAKDTDGRGLKYGTFVKSRRVTAAHAARMSLLQS